MLCTNNKEALAYIIGASIGDGNLSNPNKRAARLRITCDKKYPNIIHTIQKNLSVVAPNNKVSIVDRADSCLDISCYSNGWEEVLGWKACGGPKHKQAVGIPRWIFKDKKYIRRCLQGLFETDGSIYTDRGYLMTNFTSVIPNLSADVTKLIDRLGYTSKVSVNRKMLSLPKYTTRICKDAHFFIDEINLKKN